MGERKGQNKYYPPDYDPRKGGLNKFLGTHALRERARKIDQGIIIIRFEMPYNIWCDKCENHIGMGVRYNAEKKKVGNYYSTPVFQFRMKCHLCDNHFEIETDPANLDYKILTGARRQENRWDPQANGQVVPETKELQKKLVDDPMFKLEHQMKDIKKGEDSKPNLVQLYERSLDVWNDNYESNSRLRASFRNKKKELKILEEKDQVLKLKSSLDIDLLPESESDKKMAALLRLQSVSAHEMEKEKRLEILMKPALPSTTPTTFVGLKKQKQMNLKLNISDLGIKRRNMDSTNLMQNEPNIDMAGGTIQVEESLINLRNGESEKNSKKSKLERLQTKDNGKVNVGKNCNTSTSLSLVCNYASSDESS